MDLFKLKRPVKKKPTFETYRSGRKPFPINIKNIYDSFCREDFISIHSGRFDGFSVIVDDPEEMQHLYANGFFGKGCLSRGFPNFGKCTDSIPLLRRRQWIRRLHWASQQAENDLSATQCHEKNVSGKINTTAKETVVSPSTESDDLSHSAQSSLQESQDNTSCEVLAVTFPLEDDSFLDQEIVPPAVKKMRLESDKAASHSKNSQTDNAKVATSSVVPVKEISAPAKVVTIDPVKTKGESEMEEDWGQVIVSGANVSAANEVLVMPDSDDEGEISLETCSSRINESLHLLPEEAFFLAWALGTLQVIDLSGNVMSLRSLWVSFCLNREDFAATYAAYHYYRANGWVVKSGIKFGAHFVLYEKGPAFNHSSYIVRVSSPVNKKCRDMRTVNTLIRLAEHAGKGVVICEVAWAEDLDLTEPNALRKMSVHSIMVQRWLSTEMRDGDDG